MKWNIKDIEKRLNLEIYRNSCSVGFDVAKFATGICVLRTDDEYLYLELEDKILLSKSKELDLVTQLNIFDDKLEELSSKILKFKPKIFCVEDCFAMMGNIWVVKILARFETLVWKKFRHNGYIYFKMAKHARDKVKFVKDKTSKKDIKEQLRLWVINKFEWDCKDNDIVDAFILSLGGLSVSKT